MVNRPVGIVTGLQRPRGSPTEDIPTERFPVEEVGVTEHAETVPSPTAPTAHQLVGPVQQNPPPQAIPQDGGQVLYDPEPNLSSAEAISMP